MKAINGIEICWQEAKELVAKWGGESFSPKTSVQLARMEDTYADMQGPEILISDLDKSGLDKLFLQAEQPGYEVYEYDDGHTWGAAVNEQSGPCFIILIRKIFNLDFTPRKILYDKNSLTLIK